MQIWTYGTDSLPLDARGGVVAIGNFDGVHAGHRALLAEARALADARACPLLVLTFEPHPRLVLRPDEALTVLTPLADKSRLLGETGVDGVAVIAFDLTVAGWSAATFVQDIVVDWLGAVAVCVGENFRFGYKALGTAETLRSDGRFELRTVALVRDGGGIVSSSRLRGE
jgi:riboflavin kinase/FMN adenylyltransferase